MKKKKYPKIHKTCQSIKIINIFIELLLSASFPSLRVTVPLTLLGCPPNTVLISGPTVGVAEILI